MKTMIRAWDGKHMYHPIEFIQTDKLEIGYHDDSGCPHTIPDIIMHYMGLDDDTGTEIYEADIIEFDDSEIGGKKVVGEVVFNTDQCLGGLEWGLWTVRGYMQTDFLGKLKVLGNVYEHPELKPK